LIDHQVLRGVNATEECEDAIGVLLLEVVVDVEKGVGDQFHPEFFDLMDDLELELVVVAEVFKFGLAGEEIFGVEVELVVECAVAGHLVVEEFAVHGAPCGVSEYFERVGGKSRKDVHHRVRGGHRERQI
jgi:hypothetical protein